MFEWHAAAVALVLAYPQHARHNLICIIPFSIGVTRISRYAHTYLQFHRLLSVNRLAFAPVHWDEITCGMHVAQWSSMLLLHTIFTVKRISYGTYRHRHTYWNCSISFDLVNNSISHSSQLTALAECKWKSGKLRARAHSPHRVINCAIKCLANYFIISAGRLWLQNHSSIGWRENEWMNKMADFVCCAPLFHIIRAEMIFSIFIRCACAHIVR